MNSFSVVPLAATHLDGVAQVLARALTYDTLTERIPAALGAGAPQRRALVMLAPTVAGVAYCSLRHDPQCTTGIVDLIAVDPRHQERGIGRRLLGEIEVLMGADGCDRVLVAGNPPRYVWPGVDSRYLPALCLFNRAGYRRTGVEFTLTLDLTENTDLERRAPCGAKPPVQLHRAKANDLEWVIEGMGDDWPATWRGEVSAALLNGHGGVTVAVSAPRMLLGFCAWGVNRDNEVGPLGVRPDHQGRGLGAALIRETMRHLQTDGFALGQLPWAGPLAFFSRVLKAQPARTFVTLAKDLA